MKLAHRVGCQSPTFLLEPPGPLDYSSGDDAIEFGASLGLVLDEWQRTVVRGLLAERPDGSLAASTGVLLVPRQSGKNSVLEVIELYGLYVAGLKYQVHSAHQADTAAGHMARLKELVLSNPELDEITTIYEGAGKERLYNRETGGEIAFSTRTKHSKRGRSPQRIVFDEAMHLDDVHLQAMVPALSAQSMNADTMPQMLYTSSAPLAASTVLHRLRDAAHNGTASGSTWMAEWGAPEGVDVSDRDWWYRTNPGLGIRISEQWIAENELVVLSPEAFAVERLGVPEKPASAGEAAMDAALWASRVVEPSAPQQPIAYGVDVSPNGEWSSIVACYRNNTGKREIEIVRHEQGTAWVLAQLRDLQRYKPVAVVLDARSAASALLPALSEAGIKIETPAMSAVASASQAFVGELVAGTLVHLGEPALAAAVAGARRRDAGDGGWTWSRQRSTVDISPLVAATLAAWGHAQAPAETKPVFAY